MRWLDDQLNGHEFEQVPGDSEEQGSLACCSPWGHKELDTTERLANNNNFKKKYLAHYLKYHPILLSALLYCLSFLGSICHTFYVYLSTFSPRNVSLAKVWLHNVHSCILIPASIPKAHDEWMNKHGLLNFYQPFFTDFLLSSCHLS